VEVTETDKHSSLLTKGINYDRKIFMAQTKGFGIVLLDDFLVTGISWLPSVPGLGLTCQQIRLRRNKPPTNPHD
jgi:hypothetical protein